MHPLYALFSDPERTRRPRRAGITHVLEKGMSVADIESLLKGGTRLSFQAIADRLTAEAVATRTGRPWAAETVRGIVLRTKG
jgi:hypothetical protein